RVYWPRLGEVDVADLVLGQLLPMAHAGLDRFGVDAHVRDRLLGVIEGRCRERRNGATWQVEAVRRIEEATNLSRPSALREMLCRYVERQASNEPVHTWSYD